MNRVGLCLLIALLGGSSPGEQSPAAGHYEPTTCYEKREIRGWTVYVNRRLLRDQQEQGRRTLELLDVKLYDITRAIPPSALEKLRQIPIWVEYSGRFPCACYHPSRKWLIDHGFNPEKAGAMEIANPSAFLRWSHEQPWMVLHELAHGYHDRFLGGYDNPEIAAAWRRAKEKHLYDSVLHYDGKQVPHYARQNPQEYFAELTEAYFGTNDFYPFVQAEVFQHDPQGAELVEKLWEVGANHPSKRVRRNSDCK